MAIEQYPVLTDYDLALRLDEINIAGPIEINQDFEAIANWIIVQYYDENGWSHWITPDDDATLKDTTSIADYGQRDSILTLGYSTSTVATNNGKRILATNKDPQWNSSPISVWDYIRRKNSDPILPSRIRAGQRLKIENFMRDLSGTGLTMLITGTRYEDESGICTMTFGQPLSPLLTILTPPPRIIEDVISNQINQPAITAGEFVPGIEERETLNFYKDIEWKYALKKGLVTQAQFKKLTAKENRALRKRVRRARG